MDTASTAEEPARGGLGWFFFVTFLVTWGIAAFLFIFPETFRQLFGAMSTANPLFVVAVAAPTIAATLVTLFTSGWRGLGPLFGRLLRFRFAFSWYAISIGLFPAAGLVVMAIGAADATIRTAGLGAVLLSMLNVLYTGPLGEEVGWRSFALPRLLQRFSPLGASLLLGAVWGVWHLPSFFASGLPQSPAALPAFLAGALGLSTIATWLFLRTGGSIVPSVLMHYTVNFALTLMGLSVTAVAVVALPVAAVVVAADRSVGWLRRPGAAGAGSPAPTA